MDVSIGCATACGAPTRGRFKSTLLAVKRRASAEGKQYRARSQQRDYPPRAVAHVGQSTGREALLRRLAAGWCVLAVMGCGSVPEVEFDQFDSAPAQEELAEFSLGEYQIPIPIVNYQVDKRPIQRNRFQLEFELFALVSPGEKSQITEAWENHQGKIRDRVIRICRNSSLEELQEPELATLKGRLLDALAPQLGANEVRQLLITEIVSHEIASEIAGHETDAHAASAH